MANINVKIIFTKDWETQKKNDVVEHSKDIARIFVEKLKVADYYDGNTPKPAKQNKPKEDK